MMATRNFAALLFDRDKVKRKNITRSPVFADGDIKSTKAQVLKAYLRRCGMTDVSHDVDRRRPVTPLNHVNSIGWNADRQPGQKPGRFWSGGGSVSSEQIRQIGDGGVIGDVEAIAEVVPEREAELGCGVHEAEEGVATVATEGHLGAAADLAPGNVQADLALGAVGVEQSFCPR